MKSTYDAHTQPLFHNNKILTLQQINSFQIGVFIKLYQNNGLAKGFNNLFQSNNSIYTLLFN